MKACSKCKESKPLDMFYNNRHNKDGLTYWCKSCEKKKQQSAKGRATWTKVNRKARLKYKFGLTEGQYEQMFKEQKGLCAICGQPETRKGKLGDIALLVVDHDHETGKIRGLLCHTCNSGIGMLRDSLSLVLSAATYLERHS